MEKVNRTSACTLARTAGLLYVLEGAMSVSGALLIPGRLIVPGDAAATAANILGNEPFYLLGITVGLVSVALHTILTALLYNLFKPVGRVAASTFAFIGLMAIVLQAVSALLQLPALIILGGGGGAGAFSAEESQSLARIFLVLRGQAFDFYLGFFGFRCAALGYLVSQSNFMPRLIGVLMGFTGLGYLTFLWPPLANAVTPFNLAIVAPGELSFVFWLLLAGVKGEQWRQQAWAAAEESSFLANPCQEHRETRTQQKDRRKTMKYGIVHHWPGGTKAQYEAVLKAVHVTKDNLPEGQLFHAAGQSPGGWTIVAIHDSKESWERFRDTILMPRVKQGIRGGFANPPQETTFEVHNMQP